MPFLADLSNVNPSTLRDVLVIGLAIASPIVAVLIARRTKIEPDPLRIEKMEKFSTRDFCEGKHAEVNRRLAGHDEDIRAIYTEMKTRADKQEEVGRQRTAAMYQKIDEVHTEMTKGFKDVERALGRIEGKGNR